MKIYFRLFTLSVLTLLLNLSTPAQENRDFQDGIRINLNNDGSQYLRMITWHQMWATFQKNDLSEIQSDFLLRRSRILMFGKIGDRFLINTHIGLNSLSPQKLEKAGGNASFVLHDAWLQYTVIKGKLDIGGGLHYWNGISRLTNASTLKFLTLDAPGHNWATMGATDQLARHLGFFAKGKLGRVDYRLAVNEALKNPSVGFDSHLNEATGVPQYVPHRAIYRNPERPGGGKVFQGYFNYQFLDQESNVLPYYAGTYLGTKKVLNIGGGFFHHVNGASSCDESGNLILHSPTSFGLDIFYDAPVGEKGLAISAYGSLVHHNWGPDFTGGTGGTGTGEIYHGQTGLLLPAFTKAGKFQPYIHGTLRDLDAYDEFEKPLSNSFGAGLNYYLAGQNAKITVEYQRNQTESISGVALPTRFVRVQAMVFL